MEGKRSTSVWVALAIVVLVLLLPPTIYMAAYFVRGTRQRDMLGHDCRSYPSESESLFFVPASKVEAAVTGKAVRTVFQD